MSGKPLPPVFDAHASQYDLELSRGLDLTGEAKEYYVQGRVGRLAELLRISDFGFRISEAGTDRSVPNPKSEIRNPKSTALRILDYGCGTGGAIGALQEAFRPAAICGTDLSEASLGLARSAHPEGVFTGLDGWAALGPFDLCYCNGVFHHIPPAERDTCLTAIHGSLRAGGWLALFENNPFNPGTRFVMRRIPFDRDAILLRPRECVARLRRAGFRVERVEFLFYFPRALATLRPLERFLYRLPLGGQYLVLASKQS